MSDIVKNVNENIEIEYRPIKKVVILELLELNNEELFERISAMRRGGQQPFPLYWAEGIAFFAMPASADIPEVSENILKGTAYFGTVMYSSMAKYKSMVTVKRDRIPVINQSKSKIYKSMAKWIKKRMNDV